MIRIAPKRAYSGVVGWLARRSVPAAVRRRAFGLVAHRLGAAVEEADRPLEEFRSLDEFFTRALRAGARPTSSDPNVAVSPVDAEVVTLGTVTRGSLLQAKGCEYTVAALLADEEAASRYEGGSYVTLYLAPGDYHRIHAPVGGRITAARHIPGRLFPVNARAVRDFPGLYPRNERLVTFIEGTHGEVAVVKVAACGVGCVTASYDARVRTGARGAGGWTRYDPPLPVAKGAEVGVFHLGSTVILVFQRGRVVLEGLVAGDRVRVGQPLGRLELDSPPRAGRVAGE